MSPMIFSFILYVRILILLFFNVVESVRLTGFQSSFFAIYVAKVAVGKIIEGSCIFV